MLMDTLLWRRWQNVKMKRFLTLLSFLVITFSTSRIHNAASLWSVPHSLYIIIKIWLFPIYFLCFCLLFSFTYLDYFSFLHVYFFLSVCRRQIFYLYESNIKLILQAYFYRVDSRFPTSQYTVSSIHMINEVFWEYSTSTLFKFRKQIPDM